MCDKTMKNYAKHIDNNVINDIIISRKLYAKQDTHIHIHNKEHTTGGA